MVARTIQRVAQRLQDAALQPKIPAGGIPLRHRDPHFPALALQSNAFPQRFEFARHPGQVAHFVVMRAQVIELALRASSRSQWQHYAAKAEVHSLRARQTRGEGYVRSRVFDEIRLAKVRLAQREPAESAAVGIHAVQLAADTRSSLVVTWLTRFSRELTGRHPDVPEVARFHEQVRDYLRKAAPTRLGDL